MLLHLYPRHCHSVVAPSRSPQFPSPVSLSPFFGFCVLCAYQSACTHTLFTGFLSPGDASPRCQDMVVPENLHSLVLPRPATGWSWARKPSARVCTCSNSRANVCSRVSPSGQAEAGPSPRSVLSLVPSPSPLSSHSVHSKPLTL